MASRTAAGLRLRRRLCGLVAKNISVSSAQEIAPITTASDS
jgi:hypothetical protein